MDYIYPISPLFDPIDEFFQFSPSYNHHQQTTQQEKVVNLASPSLIMENNSTPTVDKEDDHGGGGGRRRRKRPDASSKLVVEEEGAYEKNKKKKLIHREVERQRRKEMTSLCRSLRSLLPLEYIKGKRSASDHMHESVKYIRDLQKRIQLLNRKRNQPNRSLINPQAQPSKFSSENSQNFQENTIKISANKGRMMEVNISTAINGGLPLSRVLQTLIHGEGFNVVCCISTRVDQRLIHSIEAKANEGRRVNPAELQQKLIDLIPPI